MRLDPSCGLIKSGRAGRSGSFSQHASEEAREDLRGRHPSARSGPHWHPDLGLPDSRTVRHEHLLFKPPSL